MTNFPRQLSVLTFSSKKNVIIRIRVSAGKASQPITTPKILQRIKNALEKKTCDFMKEAKFPRKDQEVGLLLKDLLSHVEIQEISDIYLNVEANHILSLTVKHRVS